MRHRRALRLALALAFVGGRASADDPVATGADMRAGLITAATLDGSWSLPAEYSPLLTNRSLYSKSWFSSWKSEAAQRAIYSGSWTLMIGLESVATIAATGWRVDWIGSAIYRTDWMVGVDLPSCSHVGAHAGCGLGTGGFSYLRIRPRGSHWWLEAGGGSIDQRVHSDTLGEVNESTLMLSPITALYELATNFDAPIVMKWQIGPGIWGGMHNATLRPTERGRDVIRDRTWTGIYPLAAGAGPGGRTELEVILARHLSLEGDLTVAPFLLGGAPGVSAAVQPLRSEASGLPIWRKLEAGIGYRDGRVMPFKVTAELFAAELSTRRLDRAGDRGGMLRFDIPLRAPNR